MNVDATLERDPLIAEVLVKTDAVRQRVEELGDELSRDYAGLDPLLVCVLKGAVFFLADLVRRITVPCEIDFMAVSSYGNSTDSSGGRPHPEGPRGQHPGASMSIVVEDIVDSWPHPLVPAAQPARTPPGLARGLRPPDEAGPAQGRHRLPLRGVRDPEPVRDRLRARLRRALPGPAVRRGARRDEASRQLRVAHRAVPVKEAGGAADTGRGEKAVVSFGPWKTPGRPRAGPSEFLSPGEAGELREQTFQERTLSILVVLVLAFFALKIVNSSSSGPSQNWNKLVAATQAGKVTYLKPDLAGDGVTYKIGNNTYSVGIPLIHLLNQELGAARRCRRGRRRSTAPRRADHAVVERADHDPAVPALLRLLDLPDEPDAGRRLQGHELRQERAKRMSVDEPR